MGAADFNLNIGISPDLKRIISAAGPSGMSGGGYGGGASIVDHNVKMVSQQIAQMFVRERGILGGYGGPQGSNRLVSGMPGMAEAARRARSLPMVSNTTSLDYMHAETLQLADRPMQQQRKRDDPFQKALDGFSSALTRATPVFKALGVVGVAAYAGVRAAEVLADVNMGASDMARRNAPSVIASARAARAFKQPGKFAGFQIGETSEGGATLIGQTVSQIAANGRQVPQHLIEAAMRYGEKTGDYNTAASLLESNPGRLQYLEKKTEAIGGGAVRQSRVQAGQRAMERDLSQTDVGIRAGNRKDVTKMVMEAARGEKMNWAEKGSMFLQDFLGLDNVLARWNGASISLADDMVDESDRMARIRAKHPGKNTYSPKPEGHLPPPGYDTSTGGNRGMAAANSLITAGTIMQSQNSPGGKPVPQRSAQ